MRMSRWQGTLAVPLIVGLLQTGRGAKPAVVGSADDRALATAGTTLAAGALSSRDFQPARAMRCARVQSRASGMVNIAHSSQRRNRSIDSDIGLILTPDTATSPVSRDREG